MNKNNEDVCRVCNKGRGLHEYLESLDPNDWNFHVAIYNNLDYLEHEDAKKVQSDL